MDGWMDKFIDTKGQCATLKGQQEETNNYPILELSPFHSTPYIIVFPRKQEQQEFCQSLHRVGRIQQSYHLGRTVQQSHYVAVPYI